MQKFRNSALNALQRLPVTISGAWSTLTKRKWEGVVTSPVEIVILVLLFHEGKFEWAKSDSASNSMGLSLAIFPYDSLGTDVQINIVVDGAGRRYRSVVPSAEYLPSIINPQQTQTGQVTRLAQIDGNPPIEVSLLPLTRNDVRFRRKRIWSMRKELAHQ